MITIKKVILLFCECAVHSLKWKAPPSGPTHTQLITLSMCSRIFYWYIVGAAGRFCRCSVQSYLSINSPEHTHTKSGSPYVVQFNEFDSFISLHPQSVGVYPCDRKRRGG